MKKLIAALLLLALLLPVCGALAASADEKLSAYQEAETLDEKLKILRSLAEENQKEIAEGGFWNLDAPLDGVLPAGVIPEDWDAYPAEEADAFPAEAKGRPCIVLWGASRLAGGILVRFPAEMIASSLEEAEYAVVLTDKKVESGYVYTPAATSYHRDHFGYLLDLRTGRAVRFWYHRQHAAMAGYINQLDAKAMTAPEIWMEIRNGIADELSVTLEDGTVLLFGDAGGTLYVKACQGNPVNLVIPDEVGGLPVTEIEEGVFKNLESLVSVTLPDGMVKIGDRAFHQCHSLEEFHFPAGLKTIGEEVFFGTKFREIVLPQGIRTIGRGAFEANTQLVSLVIPSSARDIGFFAFLTCHRLGKVVLQEGFDVLPEYVFPDDGNNIACIYLPGSLSYIPDEYPLGRGVVVYAPEGSAALNWAAERGNPTVACSDPSELPDVSYVSEGDFDFRIFNGEAALQYYGGADRDVTVPETAGGCPVTLVMTEAFNYMTHADIIRLPATVRRLLQGAINFQGSYRDAGEAELYLAGAETEMDPYSVTVEYPSNTHLTIYAPEGSPAKAYVDGGRENYNGTFTFVTRNGD